MLKELNLYDIKRIYEEKMIHDFPACEIKPFKAIERMHQNGEYFVYGNFEGEEMIAYAFIAKPKDGKVGLLDYLAVKESERGKGYGSKTIAQIKEFLKDHYNGLIIESEHIHYAKCEEDKKKRQRRIRFYEKNGLVKLGFESRIYGTEYTVLYLNTKCEKNVEINVEISVEKGKSEIGFRKGSETEKPEINNKVLMDTEKLKMEYFKIYQMMMPKDWNEQYVEIWDK